MGKGNDYDGKTMIVMVEMAIVVGRMMIMMVKTTIMVGKTI